MSDGIFIMHDGKMVELTRTPFATEADFQKLLAEHPNLIAGRQIDADEPRRWLLVRREMSIPGDEAGGGRWSLDHLLIDQDGIPTLVEVKKAANTETRRIVVAQALDYAANAVLYWPPDRISFEFEERCRRDGEDHEALLREHLGPETGAQDFWQKVKTNLQARRIRILIVADQIPSELRRIVEFLNAQMDPAEILAVEVGQFTHGDLKAHVPRVFGHVAKGIARQESAGRQSKAWNEPSFFDAVESTGLPGLREKLAAILGWAKTNCIVTWGQGAERGSFRTAPKSGGGNVAFFESNGVAYINMSALDRLNAFAPWGDRNAFAEAAIAALGGEVTKAKAAKAWLSFRVSEIPETRMPKLTEFLDQIVTNVTTPLRPVAFPISSNPS